MPSHEPSSATRPSSPFSITLATTNLEPLYNVSSAITFAEAVSPNDSCTPPININSYCLLSSAISSSVSSFLMPFSFLSLSAFDIGSFLSPSLSKSR